MCVTRKFFHAAAASAVAVTLMVLDWTGASELTGRQHTVTISNAEFAPLELAVAPGDTIVWKNEDLVPHTVTADDESWDSGFIGAGEQWQTLVRASMHTGYFCRYHPAMTGTLQIHSR